MKGVHNFPVRFCGVALALLGLATFTNTSQAQPAGQTAGTQSPTPAPTKPPLTAKELIEQGKLQYRTEKFRQALQKFEAALKLEPQNDEALGLAAITAFRMDLQPKARELFQRRAQLPNQKASVKAYCDYWSGLTRWREAHDIVARSGELKQGRVTYKLKEKEAASVKEHVARGLEELDRALAVRPEYADALNIKNLLHAEAALMAEDEVKANEERKLALDALRKAFGFFQQASQTKGAVTANFGAPTIRVGEYPVNEEDDALLDDPMLLKLQGGRPLKRATAVLPPYRPPATKSDPNDPASGGVTPEGGAYSIGHGRGALYGPLTSGLVKVEVLVATNGSVVFAQQVGGKPEIGGLAVDAAKKWTFHPALFEGKPVQVSGVITVDVKPPKGKPSASPTPSPRPPKPN
ncbi:MAG TPA: energy transducer TonB [Blastocatellia bacterium]|nr:energy transducer TonB [Blastocatellia bacterium]